MGERETTTVGVRIDTIINPASGMPVKISDATAKAAVGNDFDSFVAGYQHRLADEWHEQQVTVGRVVIAWPAPRADALPLFSQDIQIYDYDTGEPLLAVTGMQIVLGGTAWNGEAVHVNLTMLADADGQPLRGNPVIENLAYDLVTGTIRTGVFRFVVMEMRLGTLAGKDAS